MMVLLLVQLTPNAHEMMHSNCLLKATSARRLGLLGKLPSLVTGTMTRNWVQPDPPYLVRAANRATRLQHSSYFRRHNLKI